jgi:hypothetical protein
VKILSEKELSASEKEIHFEVDEYQAAMFNCYLRFETVMKKALNLGEISNLDVSVKDGVAKVIVRR